MDQRNAQADFAPKILLILWHPRQGAAGGFIRIKEFLPYFNEFSITVIDNKPSIVRDSLKNGRIIEYSVPFPIERFYGMNFTLGRVTEWLYSFFSITRLGIRELRRGNYKVAYCPTGELPHLFLVMIMFKILYPQVKLLLDILNFQARGTTWWSHVKALCNRKSGLFQNQSFLYSLGMVIHLFFLHRLIKYADYIVTVSPYLRSVIAEYFPKDRVAVTPSGISINPKKLSQSPRTLYDGIYVGRMTSEKGIFDLLNAWRNICDHNSKARLLLIGPADPEIKKRLKQQIAKLALEKNIILKGFVSEKEKWDDLSKAKVFLHLAQYEPLVPVITLLEALASGLPVVMYDVESLQDYPYLRNHAALFVVPNKDIMKVAATVLSICSLSSKRREIISRRAVELAHTFTWGTSASVERTVLKKLVQ